LSEEELVSISLDILNDLELLGLVERKGSWIIYNVSKIGTMLHPCFQLVRKKFKDIGLLEGFRENARKDPWYWTCTTATFCVALALAKKRMDYGVDDVIKAIEYPDEYLATLNLIVCTLIEMLLDKDEVTKMFRAVFEI